MPSKPRSCIIIGAGLAGLSAAYRLRKRGWSVTVLEALQKVGGRVFSYRFKQAPKLVCELGGEWIGVHHQAMRRLCAELGLRLQRHQYAFSFWDGGQPPKRTFEPGAWCFRPEHTTTLRPLRSDLTNMIRHIFGIWISLIGGLYFVHSDSLPTNFRNATA